MGDCEFGYTLQLIYMVPRYPEYGHVSRTPVYRPEPRTVRQTTHLTRGPTTS